MFLSRPGARERSSPRLHTVCKYVRMYMYVSKYVCINRSRSFEDSSSSDTPFTKGVRASMKGLLRIKSNVHRRSRNVPACIRLLTRKRNSLYSTLMSLMRHTYLCMILLFGNFCFVINQLMLFICRSI